MNTGDDAAPGRAPQIRLLLLVACVAACCAPRCAMANVGTPLMWVGALHLSVGNLLIGIGEGLLLARLFSLSGIECMGLLVGANYGSAILGYFLLHAVLPDLLPIDLDNCQIWFWAMVCAAYCLTLVIEWPFVAACFPAAPNKLKRSILASLVVQSTSYLLLFGCYSMVSFTSLCTKLDVVPPAELSLPESLLVYYIGVPDGDVYVCELPDGEPRKVFELNSSVGRDRLVIRPNAQEDGSWNLQAMTGDRHPPQFTDLLTTQTDEVSPDYLSMHSDGRYDFFDTFGTVPQLGSASQSHWSFYSGFWPAEGLLAFNKVTNEETRYSYETPFAQWNIRNAVHLPSDKVLFQLGGDRICAIDMESRRIAQLWAGRSPVAVMKRLPAFQNGRTSGSRPQAADPVSSSAKKTTKSF